MSETYYQAIQIDRSSLTNSPDLLVEAIAQLFACSLDTLLQPFETVESVTMTPPEWGSKIVKADDDSLRLCLAATGTLKPAFEPIRLDE